MKRNKNTRRKSRRSRMRRRTNRNRKTLRGGSCGCDMKGGSGNNLANLSSDKFYPYSSQVMAPPASSRLQGGRRKKRGIQGGGLMDMMAGYGGNDQVSVFGETVGAPNMASLLNGTPLTNNSIHVQPIESKYGEHNAPLV